MSEVHFEIFRQNHATGSWALVEVLENRDQALERARSMLQDGRATAVRVVKETFDPETGGYISLNLFEDGRVNTKKKNTKIDELEDLPVCATVDDLYMYDARAAIARTLGEWLAQNKLTVTELMHGASSLEKLDSQGMVLQHALQKIAVSRAFGSDKPVTQFIRELSELCTAGIRRVYKDDKNGVFDGGAAGKFRALAQAISEKPDSDYRLNGVLAKYLKPAKTWDEKLGLLLALMSELPEPGDARELLLTAIDSLVSEVVATPAALADLLGPNPDLGHALVNLAALFLGADAGERSPAANGLAALFKHNMLNEARGTIAARILSELKSGKRLCALSWEKELSMLRQLAGTLVGAPSKHFSHEDLIEALSERSRRFVSHEPLLQFLHDARSSDEKVARLIAVEEDIVGPENKRELATFVLPLIGLRAFEEHLGASALQKLKRVAELQARVLRSGFQEVQKNQLATALDGVAKTIEERARVFASIETRFADPVDRAIALLKVASAGALAAGTVQTKARKLMMATLASRGFLSSYVSRKQQETNDPRASDAALQELTTELRAFGITHEEALRALGVQNVVLI